MNHVSLRSVCEIQQQAAGMELRTLNISVVYGSEHYVGKDKSEPHAKVCQVWTDTWLKRGGTWQIIASQDNRAECR
jgi:hypothetical protein